MAEFEGDHVVWVWHGQPVLLKGFTSIFVHEADGLFRIFFVFLARLLFGIFLGFGEACAAS